MAREVTLKQGSEEWLSWRADGIGSSDAPAIMCQSPWVKKSELWGIKTGILEEQKSNWAMERGKRLEPRARMWYFNTHQLIAPSICMEHDSHPFLRASLDGYSEKDNLVIEYKCPGLKTMRLAEHGHIPPHYQWQLVHQMLVSDAKMAHFVCYYENPKENLRKGIKIDFPRNPEMEKAYLCQATSFWRCVEDNREPKNILVDTSGENVAVTV